MSALRGARHQVEKRAAAVTESVGEKTAQAVRRDAVVAGRQLTSELGELSPLIVRTGAASLLAGHGLRLLANAASDALSRRLPRWAAETLVAGTALLLGAAFAQSAWHHRPHGLFPRTRAALTRDIE